MGLPRPHENYVNYDKIDLLKKAKLLRGKTFLLIHGTTDDVVSIQHSMLFMKSLIEQGVTYRTQVSSSLLFIMRLFLPSIIHLLISYHFSFILTVAY